MQETAPLVRRTQAYPAELIDAFALTLSKPGGKALLINSANAGERWVPIPEAAKSGVAFAVDVADDVLAIDCDHPDLVPDVLGLGDELRCRGFSPVLVNSGRPDNLHLFCRIDDADLLEDYKARTATIGLDVRRTIRPPLAPHRLGLPVSLRTPDDPAEALAALSRLKTTPPRGLAPRMEELLSAGDFQAYGYRSRSEMILALALGARNAGWTEDQFFAALMDPKTKAGDKIRHRRDRRQYVHRCYTKALRKAQNSPAITNRTAALEKINIMRAAAQTYPWGGRSGTTDRLVLEAHLKIAQDTGKLSYHASVRTVADRTGFVIDTISKANHRLERAGWLKPIKRARPRYAEATVWALRVPKGLCNRADTPTSLKGVYEECPPRCTRTEDDPGADLWRTSGVGKGTFLVWRSLDLREPQKQAGLASPLGRTKRTILYHLRKLETHGLASRTPNGWRRGDADLNEVARALGVEGTRVRTRDRHERQREHFRKLMNQRNRLSMTSSLRVTPT